AQLGDAAATGVVEVHKRKAGPGHRSLQERDRRCPRQAMLAAQMQKSADKAMAAVSVIIMAARPVAIDGEMLEHQVEQLHRLRDVGFRHWLSAPDPATNCTVSPGAAQSAAPLAILSGLAAAAGGVFARAAENQPRARRSITCRSATRLSPLASWRFWVPHREWVRVQARHRHCSEDRLCRAV